MMKVMDAKAKHTPCRSFQEICDELGAEPAVVRRKLKDYPGKMEVVLLNPGKSYRSQASYYRVAAAKAFIRWVRGG